MSLKLTCKQVLADKVVDMVVCGGVFVFVEKTLFIDVQFRHQLTIDFRESLVNLLFLVGCQILVFDHLATDNNFETVDL